MNLRFRPVLWVLASITGGLLLSLISVSAAAGHARAQAAGGAYAVISRLDHSQFPLISGQLRAYQADGSFVETLDSGQVTIQEGSQRLPMSTLDLRTPGVQFVLAVLGGSDLAFQDADGRSRLDYLLQDIVAWGPKQGDEVIDDLSLIVQGSTELLHQSDSAVWMEAVRNINQDPLRQLNPDLQILNRALAAAAASPPVPGMGKALLVITPALRTSGLTGVQSLASTARQEGVRVFIWLVASEEYGSSILTNGLRLLSADTGGAFFNYSGIESIPEIQNYLEPLRHIYEFSYNSAIRSSGVYTVAADIQSETFIQQTAPLEIAISIAPPNPIFTSLPSEIERKVLTTTLPSDGTETPVLFEPNGQNVHFLVEFPDGIQRSIRESSLLVNGEVVVVNDTPPFDQFFWDLTPYTETGTFFVRIEVLDDLGLHGSTAEFPVTITVTGPPAPSPAAIMMTPQGVLALLLSAVALGAVVGLTLLISGRIKLSHNPLAGTTRPVKRPGEGQESIPAPGQPGGRASGGPAGGPSTKPLASARSPASGLPGWMGRIQRHMQPTRTDAPIAYLTPISEGEQDAAPPLPINVDECILGSEISWTTWAIKDPSLAPIHARLRREGSAFRLFDENTISGTWVNYSAVPPQGILLSHGDAVHFGRVGFRFGLRGGSLHKPITTPLKKKHPF